MLSKCDVFGSLLYAVEQKYKAMPVVIAVMETADNEWAVTMGMEDTHELTDGTTSYNIRARNIRELVTEAKKIVGIPIKVTMILAINGYEFKSERTTAIPGPELITAMYKRVVKKALDAKGV